MSTGSAQGAPGALIGKVMRHLDAPRLGCTIILATRPERGDDDGPPVELSYMDVDDDSVHGIVSVCKDFAKHRREWAEVPLDMDADNEIPREEYHMVAKAKVPSIEIHTAATRRQIGELDPAFVARLKSLQVRLDTKGRTVVFFRRFTKGKVLSQGKKLGRLTDGRLSLSKETLMELPSDYDCCLYGDDLAVFNRLHFEEIFEYHEHHLSQHREVFEGLKNAKVNIANFDDMLEKTRSNKRMLRKFGAIMDKGIYEWDFAKISRFLKRRKIKKISTDAKTRTVTFDGAQAMLDFYNDAHLDSKATQRRYRAQSKSPE